MLEAPKNLREETYEKKRELWRARQQGAAPAQQQQPPPPQQPVFPLRASPGRAPQPALLDRASPGRPLPSRDAPLTDVNPVTGAPCRRLGGGDPVARVLGAGLDVGLALTQMTRAHST